MKYIGATLLVAASYATVVVMLWRGFNGWWTVWPILASCAALSIFTRND